MAKPNPMRKNDRMNPTTQQHRAKLLPPSNRIAWNSRLRVLAGLLAVLAAGAVGAQTPALQITRFKLDPNGTVVLEWTGSQSNLVLQLSSSITSPDWQPVPGVNWPIDGTNWTGVVPPGRRQDFVRLAAINQGMASMPSQTYSLDLIGIHDPGSANYNANCIGCHGARTNEMALDGRTPTAHSRKLPAHQVSNAECIRCHEGGADLLSFSHGDLRKQVNLIRNDCAVCHRKGKPKEFYNNTTVFPY